MTEPANHEIVAIGLEAKGPPTFPKNIARFIAHGRYRKKEIQRNLKKEDFPNVGQPHYDF